MIAHNPLHGSGQAGLPHPALALGNDAHAAQRIRREVPCCIIAYPYSAFSDDCSDSSMVRSH